MMMVIMKMMMTTRARGSNPGKEVARKARNNDLKMHREDALHENNNKNITSCIPRRLFWRILRRIRLAGGTRARHKLVCT